MGTMTGNIIRPERRLSPSKEALLRKRVQGAFKALNHGPQIPRRAETGPAPLSFAQQRLWFLQQLEPDSAAYNVATALRLTGPLDLRALEHALTQIHQRHEVLRATFPAPDGTPVQIVSSDSSVQCRVVDLQHFPADQRQCVGAETLHEEARQPFDLINGPVVRYTLLRYGPDDHLFSILMHHVVIDGWSITLFFRELEALYDSLANTRPAELPELPIQYSDFSAWQRTAMTADSLRQNLQYWKTTLAGAPASIDLPTDRDERRAGVAQGASHSIQLPPEFCATLASETHARGTTEFMMLAAALAVTLYRWSGQQDLVIGTVAAGRTRREIENLIGCFMNFLPVRTGLSEEATGAEFLSSVKTTILEAYAHQDCPFDKIVEALNPARVVHRTPLYNVALLLQNFPSGVLSSDVLSAEFVSIETKTALLDLRFIAKQDQRGLSVVCEYDTALFDLSTVETLLEAFRATLTTLVEAPQTRVRDFQLPQPLAVQAAAARSRQQVQSISVAATFTADPLQDSVLYWLNELEISAKIAFAPYNQVFQQLLDPASVLHQNRSGLNVILLRLEDWYAKEQGNGSSLSQTARDFLSALKAATARSSVPWLICFCPTPGARDPKVLTQQNALRSELQTMSGVYVLSASEILRLYPVENVFDTAADRLGNVPYTPAFFAVLGTMLVRIFHALKRPPRKVIALDCDNTLWDGVCGEDGPHGIRLEPWRKALQEFMRRQLDAGMLLCLCTKNNEADIAETFQCRSDFPLRREDFVAARVNWKPKSENLKCLARELNVGLDSFIFLDDNPMEIAEVEANCPGVLALLLPENLQRIPSFLDHAWVFDHLKVTDEDKKRARLYQENRQREELRAQCVSMAEFLAGLNLNLQIDEARPEQFSRISQLTQRTNQFNFTTRRYSEGEIQQLSRDPGAKLFAVSVTDRFGDYGLVGVLLAHIRPDLLDVDTFLLSCRVLGKGVEHRLLAYLGQLAEAKDLSRVDLHFRASSKNRPALDFLESTAAAFRQNNGEGYLFTLPARFAAAIHCEPAELESSVPAQNNATGMAPTELPQPLKNCRTIALHSHDPKWLLQSIEDWTRAHSRPVGIASSAPYTAPRAHIERELCGMWSALLGLERVGIHDDFFALGGSSLLAVRLFAQIEKSLGKAVPLVTIFQCPTVEKLAHAIEQRKGHTPSTSIVPIQAAGTKPPLVLVHGAGGGILWGYANLATHLGQDQPVYAIEPRLAAAGRASLTVEEMARQYLVDWRALQPRGPYYIGGYCFGGYVAYEMARLLRQTGDQVALLVLIDSAAPNGRYERVSWWRPAFYFHFARNTCYWIEDYAGLPPRERWRFITRKAGVLMRKIFGVRRRVAAVNLPGFHSQSGDASPHSKAIDIKEYIDPVHFPDEELRLWQVHLNAGATYKPKPYDGRVTLLRTRGQPFFCSFDPQYGWDELAAGGVEVRIVPGSHEAIFVEPDVRSLAAQVAACIRQTRAGAATSVQSPASVVDAGHETVL